MNAIETGVTKERRKLFYRIEDRYGVGLFQKVWYHDVFPDDEKTREEHPGPERDAKLKQPWGWLGSNVRKYRFGFKNKNQIKKWFKKSDMENLIELSGQLVEDGDHPIRISVYRAPIIEGESQVVFKNDWVSEDERAKLIKMISLDQFLQMAYKERKAKKRKKTKEIA